MNIQQVVEKQRDFFNTHYTKDLDNREKVLRKTREEVPHAVTVVLENYEEKKEAVIINAAIIVERDGIKKILVGHNGEMIKDIGISARKDIEDLVGKRVYLDLFVKTVNNWRDRDKYLVEFEL